MTDIAPIPEASPDEILKERAITVHRQREPQPALNQPQQDTIPGTGSGDS